MSANGLTAKNQIRTWWYERIGADAPRDVSALKEACVRDMLRDPDFPLKFAAEYVAGIVDQIADGMVRSRVAERYQHNVGTRLMTTDQLREEIATEDTPWARWITTDRGAPVPLLEMTKGDLLSAAEEKRRRGDMHYKDAAFFRAIADTLSDEEVVGDRWKAKDLEVLYERISLRIKAEVVLVPALHGKAAT